MDQQLQSLVITRGQTDGAQTAKTLLFPARSQRHFPHPVCLVALLSPPEVLYSPHLTLVFSAISSKGLTIEAVLGISVAVLVASSVASIIISIPGLHPLDLRPAAPGVGAILIVVAVVISVAVAGIRVGLFGVFVGAIAGTIHIYCFINSPDSFRRQ